MNHEGAFLEQGDAGDQKGKSVMTSVIRENSPETCPHVAGTTRGTKSKEGGGSCILLHMGHEFDADLRLLFERVGQHGGHAAHARKAWPQRQGWVIPRMTNPGRGGGHI